MCLSSGWGITYQIGCASAEHLNWRPNDRLFGEMVRVGLRRGVAFVELGGGIGMDSDDTLFKFKQKFGDRTLPTYIARPAGTASKLAKAAALGVIVALLTRPPLAGCTSAH